MRSFVNLRAVALLVTCVIGSSLGRAWGEEGDPLEPVAPAQTAPARHDLDPQSVNSLPPPRTVVPGTAANSANPLWDVPLSALSATRDRPLFSASRRPPPVMAPVTVMRAPPPPPPPKEPERPALQLVGTVIGDEESFGIFVDPASQTSLRLRVGASHDGWLLDAVKRRGVTLRRELEVVTLPMPQLGEFAEGVAQVAPAPRDRMARRAR